MIVSPTVYIVDDDASIRSWLDSVLSEAGFRVRGFDSAAAFFAIGQPASVACLILDVRMPGMDGLSLHRQLREQHIEIPTIFLTGFSDISSAVQAMQQGAADVLQKPVSPTALIDAVHQAIQQLAEPRRQSEFRTDLRQRLSNLSGREQTVLNEYADGKTTHMIAAEHGLNDEDVNRDHRQILKKTGVYSVTVLVRDMLLARL